MKYHVRVKVKQEPIPFAQVLDEMAEYLEGQEPPPDHWDEDKRDQFYLQINEALSPKACDMINKLFWLN